MQCLARAISRLIEEPGRGLAELRNVAATRRADDLYHTRYWLPTFRMAHLMCQTEEVWAAEREWRHRYPTAAAHIPDMIELCEMLDQTQLLRFIHMAQVAGLLEALE